MRLTTIPSFRRFRLGLFKRSVQEVQRESRTATQWVHVRLIPISRNGNLKPIVQPCFLKMTAQLSDEQARTRIGSDEWWGRFLGSSNPAA